MPVALTNVRCWGWTGKHVLDLSLSAHVESPGGISPLGAPKTVREPLDSHGSRCSTVGTQAAGFTSSTGSSCCHYGFSWPVASVEQTQPLRSSPITEPSSLLRATPP